MGLLIFVGLFSRIAAFIAAGEMAVAQFWQQQPNGLHPLENGSGPAVLFCFAFLQLVFIGGLHSLDTGEVWPPAALASPAP